MCTASLHRLTRCNFLLESFLNPNPGDQKAYNDTANARLALMLATDVLITAVSESSRPHAKTLSADVVA